MKNEKIKLIIVGISICFVLFWSTVPLSYEQSIPITISPPMQKTVFDGKWTFTTEWKPTSLTELNTEFGNIYIRTAHQENYLYVMLNVVADTTIAKNKDNAMICFDTAEDKSTSPDDNDYCFFVSLGTGVFFGIGKEEPITLRGSIAVGKLGVIQNHEDFIAIGDASDKNDRYSPVPHATYEFRIPIDILQRSDRYGFFVSVFDSDTSTTYTWPPELQLGADSKVPSPQEWGVLYSPDKSLPEYELPLFVLAFAILPIILATSKYRKNLFSLYK